MAFRRNKDDGPGPAHYRMREKMFAIGDDYWIEDNDGQKVFKVNGKALRIRDTLVIEDLAGNELYKIQEKKLSIRDAMEIERGNDTIAKVKKAMINPIRDRYIVHMEEGKDFEAKGNIVDHEYKIERDDHKVAEISKKWFRIRDTYGIEIAPGENDALILAAAVCIDEMAGRG
jgi:uncharacterized protein YxjI